jgi:hypothetical protein
MFQPPATLPGKQSPQAAGKHSLAQETIEERNDGQEGAGTSCTLCHCHCDDLTLSSVESSATNETLADVK